MRFYDRTALSGATIKLRSVRSPDFFGLLRYQSDRFSVLLDHDDQGEIRGMATLIHRAGYLCGEKCETAYLGDFRVSFDRRAMRLWRGFYESLLRKSALPTLTCVIDENLAAQNALIRQRKSSFIYEPLAQYIMVNVLAKTPWPKSNRKIDAGLEVRLATQENLPALEAFLDRQEKSRAFGYCFGSGELQRRLKSWDGLDFSRFFLIQERGGRILGCFALWSPSQAKVNILERIPLRYQLYRTVVPLPRTGEPLKAMYLTHLEIDRSLEKQERQRLFGFLFDAMASTAWDKSWHMVSFCDFPSVDFRQSLASRFLFQEIKMKLFTVRHPESTPLSLDPREASEPGFEIALV